MPPTATLASLECGGAEAREDADARLASLGYKAELKRNLGMMSILGLSFSIIAAPFGLSTAFSIA